MYNNKHVSATSLSRKMLDHSEPERATGFIFAHGTQPMLVALAVCQPG